VGLGNSAPKGVHGPSAGRATLRRGCRDAGRGNPVGGEARARGQGRSRPRLGKTGSRPDARNRGEKGVADGGPQRHGLGRSTGRVGLAGLGCGKEKNF
jgi:hypothetical protein